MAPACRPSTFLCFAGFFTVLTSLDDVLAGHSELFPKYDEYDPHVIDPTNVFGSPYGRFSRNTQSLLAALPLKLPDRSITSDQDGGERPEPLYMKVRDVYGRLYACRVFLDGELEAGSLEDSLFDPPKLILPGAKQLPEKPLEDDRQALPERASHSGESLPSTIKTTATRSNENVPAFKATEISNESPKTAEMSVSAEGEVARVPAAKGTIEERPSPGAATLEGQESSKVPDDIDDAEYKKQLAVLAVEERLTALAGLCGHYHAGYWSYEWCYKSHVSQFHITLENQGNMNTMSINELTMLGKHTRRIVNIDLKNLPENPLAEDQVEVARVADMHEGGDVCPETDEPRTTLVQMLCCSTRVLLNGQADELPRGPSGEVKSVVTVHKVFEDPNKICSYVITLCTTVLCESDPAARILIPSKSTNETAKERKRLTPKDDESVREILERILGGQCMKVGNGGWWSYEICHGDRIRQYHEVFGAPRDRDGVTQRESEHNLGWYVKNEAEGFPNEDEWKHVVNGTKSVNENGGGNYFAQEYKGGDVCDHRDVTQAAVIAGGAGVVGVIRRATSVRYYCGISYQVTVREDSTCHYILDVVVPELCKHPLFMAPVKRKQVFKCLLVDEEESTDLDPV